MKDQHCRPLPTLIQYEPPLIVLAQGKWNADRLRPYSSLSHFRCAPAGTIYLVGHSVFGWRIRLSGLGLLYKHRHVCQKSHLIPN